MPIKKIITSKTILWNENLRFKVGETCLYNGIEWSNLTGKNNLNPENSIDWFKISSKEKNKSLIIEGNTFNWYPKDSNVSEIPEINDPATGRINNKFYPLITYKGGELNPAILSSWNIKNEKQLY